MEVSQKRNSHLISYAILAVGLGAMELILVLLVTMVIQGVDPDPDAEQLLSLVSALARIALIALAVNTILLFWAGLRTIRQALPKNTGPTESTYVDAWSLAGKRLKVQDQDEDQDTPAEDDD